MKKEAVIIEMAEDGDLIAIHATNPDIEIYIIDHTSGVKTPVPIEIDRLIDTSIPRYLSQITEG